MECHRHVCSTHGAEQKTEAAQAWGGQGSISMLLGLMREKAALRAVYEIWLKRAKLSPLHNNVLVSGGGIGARHTGSNSHANLAKSVKFSEPISFL